MNLFSVSTKGKTHLSVLPYNCPSKMEEYHLKNLIIKYFKGTASPEERAELLDWYNSIFQGDLILPYENEKEEERARLRILRSLHQKIRKPNTATPIISPLLFKLAGAALVFITLFVGVRQVIKNNGQSVTEIKLVSTLSGQHKQVRLNDGSVIWIGPKSQVSFPLVFKGPTREVSFEGEAFFVIAKDKMHPFIVHAGKTSTQVLGTSFNIISRSSRQNLIVSLITGKVSFSDGKLNVELLPGHEVVYNKLSGTRRTEIIADTATITGRRNGQYEYKDIRVADVIEDLNLNFNTKILIKGDVKNCLFYGRIKPGESMENFLQKLAMVVNAKLIKLNSGYLIKGRGCN